MPITPRKDEDQTTFMGRCMHELDQADKDKPVKDRRPQDQRVAICFSAWRAEHGGKKPA